jgi:hypothetical protein
MAEDWRAALATWFGDDLHELVNVLGGEVQSARELTRLVSARQRKASFRLDFADGRRCKARRFRTAESASSALALSPLLEALPFSRILVARGLVAVEQWIEGIPLQPGDVSVEQAQVAGALLGRVHAITGLPADLLAHVPGGNWHADSIDAHLQELVAAGVLATAAAARLHAAAMANQPGRLAIGLVHGDFCADNIVVDCEGELFVVDNESLHLGALDYDLARCWVRWPMSESLRAAFAGGYRSVRGLEGFTLHATFWAIKALSQSIAVHLRHNKRCEPALEALLRISGERGAVVWPERSALS